MLLLKAAALLQIERFRGIEHTAHRSDGETEEMFSSGF
jgi:hypothetical protein